MNWDLVDWVCAFMLISFAVAAYLVVQDYLVYRTHKILAGLAIAIIFLLIWVQLAVGLID